MHTFLHLLSRMYSSSMFYAHNPALEIVDQQKSVNVCLRMHVPRECSAEEPFDVQHPVSLRTSLHGSCIPGTIFYRYANSVILRAHLCTAVASMQKLCSKSFTRSRFFMLSLQSRLRRCIYVCLLLPRSPCTSFVSIMHALSFCSLCVPCPFFSQIRYCCLPNTNTTKRNIRHISDWSKCTIFDTPQPKLMQHKD